MSLSERLDSFQRRRTWSGYPLAVLYKFFDDTGGHLTALITYYAFLSLFPLLLLASTLLSVIVQGDADTQHRLLSSALAQFPVIGEQLSSPERLSGGVSGAVVGVLGALYGGLGARTPSRPVVAPCCCSSRSGRRWSSRRRCRQSEVGSATSGA